jgi:hypothetical protein
VTVRPVIPLDPASRHGVTHPLDRLFAEVGAPVRRVVFGHGVDLRQEADGRWLVPSPVPSPRDPALTTLRALGLAPAGWTGGAGGASPGGREAQPGDARRGEPSPPHDGLDPDALARRHGLRPILLATPGGAGGDVVHLASAAGTLAWRPPLDRVADTPAFAPHARRLRFAVDAVEHHLTGAAERYAAATLAARRAALLFGTHELTALAGHTAAYLEIDAALAAALRIYREVAALVWAAFGPEPGAGAAPPRVPRRFDSAITRARGTPGDLREALLESWATHGAAARVARHLLTEAAAETAHAPMRVASLEADVWAASIPIPDPCVAARVADRPLAGRLVARRRVDALDHAWDVSTEALRAATLTLYGVIDTA